MSTKIKFGKYPNDDIVQWFVDHIGPRTHHLPDTIGGKGWLFEFEEVGARAGWNVAYREWYITVDDEHEKTLTYYFLMR